MTENMVWYYNVHRRSGLLWVNPTYSTLSHCQENISAENSPQQMHYLPVCEERLLKKHSAVQLFLVKFLNIKVHFWDPFLKIHVFSKKAEQNVVW